MPKFVTDEFERLCCQRLDVPHAIAVNSGTSALIAALWSLDLQSGDEVITTPLTFVATANAILIAGGQPVFADIDPDTLLIDPHQIDRLITPRTRAVIPVHLFGRVCPMADILETAKNRQLVVIEDAAQALGADGVGLSDAACFSFYKTKNLSTFEGGMITIPSRSQLDAAKIRAITNQGDCGHKQYEWIGFNFRMPEPCALIGLQALKLHWPGVMAELGRYGLQDGYYPQLVYQHPAYQRRGIRGDCPIAERVADSVRLAAMQEVGI